jgi:hypothetical protein
VLQDNTVAGVREFWIKVKLRRLRLILLDTGRLRERSGKNRRTGALHGLQAEKLSTEALQCIVLLDLCLLAPL